MIIKIMDALEDLALFVKFNYMQLTGVAAAAAVIIALLPLAF